LKLKGKNLQRHSVGVHDVTAWMTQLELQNPLPRFNSGRGLQDLVKLGLVRVNIKSTDWRRGLCVCGGSAIPL
jgi:hypothetical protein